MTDLNPVQRNVPATATTLSAAYGWFVAEVMAEIPDDWPGFVLPAVFIVAGFVAFGIGKVAQRWTRPDL